MKKLIDHAQDIVPNGAVLRFPAKWPYEDFVDLMFVSMPDEASEFGLVVTTGQKAGLILVKLPKECESYMGRGVRAEWLISNWEKWIYQECDASEVYLIRRYPTTSL
ncbi:Imm45 family immunity protein [Pseudomonas sp. MLB6B]